MLRKHIAGDLGTANPLVFVQSQGIVINEPSVVAVDTINERVIAVGKEAKDYIGKTPQRISTIRPLRDGVIADFDAAQALIASSSSFLSGLSLSSTLTQPGSVKRSSRMGNSYAIIESMFLKSSSSI